MAAQMTEVEFLAWSVNGRHQIQTESVRLLELMRLHSKASREQKLQMRRLVGVAFALWRAVFLANRTSKVDLSFKASGDFLTKVLIDNTITFTFDVQHSEFTFRFYADAARQNLRKLREDWPDLKIGGYETSTEVWDNLLLSFIAAHGFMKADLEEAEPEAKPVKGKVAVKKKH